MCMTHNNIIKSQQKGGAGLHTDINVWGELLLRVLSLLAQLNLMQ